MHKKRMNPGASANAHGAQNAVSACGSDNNKADPTLQQFRAEFLARRFRLEPSLARVVAEHAFKVEGAR